jgi:hypothetical protein
MGQGMKNTPKKKADQIVFRETLSPTIPLAPTADILTPYQVRSLVVIVWALAAIALGVGVGLLLTPKPNNTATITPPDVQTADIPLASAQTPTTITVKAPVSATLAGTASALGVTQAQAGTPIQTVSSNYLQPSAVPAAYAPGFGSYQNLQGTIGTTPVSK